MITFFLGSFQVELVLELVGQRVIHDVNRSFFDGGGEAGELLFPVEGGGFMNLLC